MRTKEEVKKMRLELSKCLECGCEIYKYRGTGYDRLKRYCSNICKNKGNSDNKHYNWKGNKIGYSGVHIWLYKNYGKANKCEGFKGIECSGMSENYEWANISGKYLRNRKDWRMLCISCHIKSHRQYDKWNREGIYINRKRGKDGRFK